MNFLNLVLKILIKKIEILNQLIKQDENKLSSRNLQKNKIN